MKIKFLPNVFILIAVTLASTANAQFTPGGTWSAIASDSLEVFPDLIYRTVGGQELKLDLYVPYEKAKSAPILVWFHGGGWTRSSKEKEMLYILPYLEAGWAVANVEYRLAASAKAPAALEDCRCAVSWLGENAESHKLDRNHLVLSGISAGGHLALATAYLSSCSYDDCRDLNGATIRAVVNWFGPSDIMDLIAGPNVYDQAVEWIGTVGERENVARQASPVNFVRRGLPPTITIHGDKDELIPFQQSSRLHRALTSAGVDNRLVRIRGGGHGDFKKAQLLRSYASIRNFLDRNKIH